MKLALVTRADSNIKKYTDLTHPILKKYAKMCGADFIVLDHEPPIRTEDNMTHYRILKGYELLDTYDRILFLDSDMIINKNCPNIFDIVPYGMIGSIYEDKGSRRDHRHSLIRNIQKIWGDVGWSEGYTNAGTYLVSKPHKDIFQPYKGQYWLGFGSADVQLTYQTYYYGYNIFELPFQWNHMTMFSEDWNNYYNRFESYIIHYAGSGIFEDGKYKNKLEQMVADLNFIYNS
jgi:alpha-N-acetylglucosamine transferase